MKRLKIFSIVLMVLFFSSYSLSRAQSAELIGGNMLNGAITGTVLGAATMGLQNTNDFTPLRIGLGSGIIGGMGIAIYDVSIVPKGQQFFISGLFNDGTNSSIIVLLDTVYGATAGAALGAAVMLISNEPVLEGLQYGSGAGAWAGFAVGLFDSFVFAEKNNDFVASKIFNRSSLVQIEGSSTSLALIQPDLFQYKKVSKSILSYDVAPALTLFSLQKTF